MGAYGHGENSFDVAAGETDIGSGAANGVLAVLDVEFDWNSGLQSGIGAAIVVHGRVVLVLRSFLCSGRSYAPVVLAPINGSGYCTSPGISRFAARSRLSCG